MSKDRNDDGTPGTEGTGGSSAFDPESGAVEAGSTESTASAAVTASEAEATGSAKKNRRGAKTAEKGAGAAAVPTGKAGRGNTAVAERVRADADEPEDTRSRRANPVQYFLQVVEELRKVIWPTRGQMATYTVVVFLFLIFMTALVSGVDFGAGKLVELVFDKK